MFVLTATILLEIYTLRQFEKVTTIAIEHEGNLLSDLLEASITPYLETRDIEGMQANLDRIAAIREKNDIEMNIMLLEGDGSATVASNVPSNIEGADPEEHEELLKSLLFNQPIVFIEEPDLGEDPDEELIDESHPDFYISGKKRIISITTPLAINERQYGSINVASSLGSLDDVLEHSRSIILVAASMEVLIVMIGLGFIFNYTIFKPLRLLTSNMYHVAAGDLSRELRTSSRDDEIGLMSRAFNSMAQQLLRARNQLHQYLDPMAIEEAYRRAGTESTESLAEEREISVLFVDIVSFTTTSERLGPTLTVAYLNRFYDLISTALIDSGGYIDKFVADEAVCIFDGVSHAENAVSAARNILRCLNEDSPSDPVQVRIGINTGKCIIADIGSQEIGRLDRTIIGDTVNVAQRLMSATQPNTALLSEFTFASCPQHESDISPFGEQQLKGKKSAVMTYRLE